MTGEHRHLLRLREQVDKLPEDKRIQVEAIVRTFRSALRAGGALAEIALALVHAEVFAAKEREP